MHDCPKIQEKLFDLVLHEIEPQEQRQILAEAETCPVCQAEFKSIEKTLLMYDRAVALNEPTAAEWQIYEQNLRAQFTLPQIANKTFWKRFLTTSIRIPAPVLAAITLFVCAGMFFALRSPKSDSVPSVEITQTAQPNLLIATVVAPEKIIVREERVVTRRIYLAKRLNERNKTSYATSAPRKATKTDISPLNLAEFKPVQSIAPSIIKGGKPK